MKNEAETSAEKAEPWYCETHPDKEMGHNGCKGAGIPPCAQVPMLAHWLRMAQQEARESHLYRDDLIRQLTAALKDLRADAPVAEPVADVAGVIYGIDIQGDEAHPLVEWSEHATDLPEGTKLYTRPPAPEEGKDAARVASELKTLADTFADSKAERWCGRGRGAQDPELWERDRAALHRAIDAALSQGDGS